MVWWDFFYTLVHLDRKEVNFLAWVVSHRVHDMLLWKFRRGGTGLQAALVPSLSLSLLFSFAKE